VRVCVSREQKHRQRKNKKGLEKKTNRRLSSGMGDTQHRRTSVMGSSMRPAHFLSTTFMSAAAPSTMLGSLHTQGKGRGDVSLFFLLFFTLATEQKKTRETRREEHPPAARDTPKHALPEVRPLPPRHHTRQTGAPRSLAKRGGSTSHTQQQQRSSLHSLGQVAEHELFPQLARSHGVFHHILGVLGHRGVVVLQRGRQHARLHHIRRLRGHARRPREVSRHVCVRGGARSCCGERGMRPRPAVCFSLSHPKHIGGWEHILTQCK
jgi:hypothetical protein